MSSNTIPVPAEKRPEPYYSRLLALADHIEALPPEQFAMKDWLSPIVDESGHVCGTAACIAGWAAALWGDGGAEAFDIFDTEIRKQPHYFEALAKTGLNFEGEGRKVLGLSWWESDRLFFGVWPKEYEGEEAAPRLLRDFANGLVDLDGRS